VADDSKTTEVGQRYARALFDLAKDERAIAPVEADLKSLKAALRESKDLRTLVGSPAFSAETKSTGLKAIADKAKFHATTKKFLGLLAANGRANALPSIITSFEALAARERGAVSAEVVTAIPLSAAQAKRWARILKSKRELIRPSWAASRSRWAHASTTPR
jgi:F-type H+-transporting ATPase subunit delta